MPITASTIRPAQSTEIEYVQRSPGSNGRGGGDHARHTVVGDRFLEFCSDVHVSPSCGRLGEARRLVDQLLRGDIEQFVLGRSVEDAFLADLEQYRHGERRDAVEPAILD